MVGTQTLPAPMASFSYITCIRSKCLDLSGGASQASLLASLQACKVNMFLPGFNVLKCDIDYRGIQLEPGLKVSNNSRSPHQPHLEQTDAPGSSV